MQLSAAKAVLSHVPPTIQSLGFGGLGGLGEVVSNFAKNHGHPYIALATTLIAVGSFAMGTVMQAPRKRLAASSSQSFISAKIMPLVATKIVPTLATLTGAFAVGLALK